jgi:hypothetical protein
MKCASKHCKTRIVSHLWVVGDLAFCSPSCQRGKGPDLFAKLWDDKRKKWKFEEKK